MKREMKDQIQAEGIKRMKGRVKQTKTATERQTDRQTDREKRR